MKVRSDKASRRSAQLARRAPVSPVAALPAATAFSRRPWRKACAVNGVAAAVAGILYGASGAAYAQAAQATDQAPATAPGGGDSLQEVVVTANAAQGVKKLDASYNIVAVDAEQIREANPKSTADILKVSPGIWPEASGGQTGANIEVAGFPSGGDSPFFTNMIEGLPMYGMPSLSFMDSSSLFRLDDTIERVEVVQGGPGAVFGPAQMGATANFILRRGTDTPTGDIGVTWGNEGLVRVDGFYGFKIADGWYGSAGGFYRSSDGVRNPQFQADQGGQFTATLSHDLDGGSLMFWSRVLDDKNQFIVPVPVIESASGDFSAYPGFSPLTGSYGSRSIQNVTLPNPAGGFETADLANGRGGTLYYFGSKYDQKIGDSWSLLNNFMVDGGQLNTNALFSGPNPRPLSYYLYGCQVAQPAGYCKGATAVDTNNLGTGGQGLPLSTDVQATYAGSGLAVNPNQSVLTQGWWYIQKTLQNVTDEFRASKEIFSGNTLTGGVYLARYSDDDNWSLGNTMLMANVPNTQAINLEYVNGGHIYHLTSNQGFVNFNGNFNILEHGDAMNTAGYLSDAWKLGPWLFDASARLENINAHQRTCNTSKVQMGSQYDLWDNAVPLCNGTYAYEHYVRTRPVFTGGVNYEITQSMSAYFRANTGVHYDDFDNGIRGTTNNLFAPLETVTNYEVGYKWQTAISYLDVSAYHRVFDGLQYQESNLEGVPFGPISTYGSTTKGIDVVGTLTPFKGFNIRVVGDYEDGKFQDYIGCLKYIDINGNPQCAQINGSPLERQPKFQIRVTPSYTVVPGPWGDVTAWVTYEHVGQRYEDLTGLQPLGTYYTLAAGIVTDIGNNWEFRVQGTNLTNQIGLTEGNARVTGGESGVGGVLLARPYEGREVNVTAKYKF
jgi:outer membrane receptor protein involved in Fe transport